MASGLLPAVLLFVMLLLAKPSFAVCVSSPDEGKRINFTVKKITRMECNCKGDQGKTEKISLPACLIEGENFVETYLREALSSIGIKQTPNFSPRLLDQEIHNSSDEELCQKKPGDSITAYLRFNCNDVHLPPPDNESCNHTFIKGMCAGKFEASTSISTKPPIEPSNDSNYKLSE